MAKKGLFLDDERTPIQVTWINYPSVDWDIVRTVGEFSEAYRSGAYEVVSLDHDLQDFCPVTSVELTGKHAAMYMVHLDDLGKVILPEIFVHSMNPVGKENIKSYIDSYKRYKGV